MILRAVIIELTRNAAIDAAPVLAGKAEHAIEARVATWRGLDAAHALLGHVHALSAELARHAAVAGTAAGKDALLDRYAVEVVATGLDANRTDGTVVVCLASRLGRTGATYRIGHTQGLGPDARGSSIATITARISASVVSAANCEHRREQQHSKPSISHKGLLINKFTEICR
jgi:hypothetical protein